MKTPTSARQTALGLSGVLVVSTRAADAPRAIVPGILLAAPLLTSRPAHATSRSASGVSTAAIRLRDVPTMNQDVCENTSFALTWSRTAQH